MPAASSEMTRIVPAVDQPSQYYHQFLSWRVTEDDWNKEGIMLLELRTKIPGTVDLRPRFEAGGVVSLSRKGELLNTDGRIGRFKTFWPDNVEVENINIDIVFKLKKGFVEVGQFSFRNSVKTGHKVNSISKGNLNVTRMTIGKFQINPSLMNLYDETRAFTIEAEILVFNKVSIQVPNTIDYFTAPSEFVKDIGAIFKSEETSDTDVVCNGKVFKCHRIILCARSSTFSNMLLGDMRENDEKKVDMKDTTVEAVEEMLRYIYTGEISESVDKLNEDLLQLADMYDLNTLKTACGEVILSKLEVSNCISSYIMADRFFMAETRVRKMLDLFMTCKAEKVVECEDLDRLVAGFPGLVKDLMRVMVKGGKEAHGCWFCSSDG